MLEKNENDILKKMGYKKNKIKNATIVGASSYGTIIIEEIAKKKISTKLIELDKVKAKKLDEKLLSTVILHGDGTDHDVLKKNGVNRCDLFISATNDGFNNIISCKLAKTGGALNTVSITFNKSIYNLSYMLGVDVCLNPHFPVIDKVLSTYYPENIVSIKTIANEDANIIEVNIEEEYFIVNKKLKDLNLGDSVLIGLIKRNNILFLPTGEDYIMLNDTIFLFLSKKDINKVLENFFK
jgi:trk system potassium uptake protein TrkA